MRSCRIRHSKESANLLILFMNYPPLKSLLVVVSSVVAMVSTVPLFTLLFSSRFSILFNQLLLIVLSCIAYYYIHNRGGAANFKVVRPGSGCGLGVALFQLVIMTI